MRMRDRSNRDLPTATNRRGPITPDPTDGTAPDTEPGFEIAQSMGIALLGLVVAATFAGALQAVGVDVVESIRTQIFSLGG